MSAATWVVDALLASTLLMAAVLIARGPVRRAFGPQIAYALWALPALRLLLPPLPAGWWRAAAAAPITRVGETVVYIFEPGRGAAATATGLAPPSLLPSPALLLGLAWATGAALFLGWHIVRHRRFCRTVLRDARPLAARDGVQVIASAAAPGPLAFGVRHRVIVFPADFAERYDAEEQALALQHELGHHRRRDLLANWAALAVLALHWFSPLAWWSFRAFRADQELANDAGVLARCAPGAAHAYGRAIVKAAAPGFVPSLFGATACHLHTIADLKGRLRMLTISRASRRRLATGSAAVTLLVAGGLGLTASGNAAERVSATLATPLPAPMAVVQTPSAPASPPVPPVGTHRRHVVVVENGATRTYEGDDADAYIASHHLPVPPVPPVPPVVGATAVAPAPPQVVVVRRDVVNGEPIVWRMDVPHVINGRCPGDQAQPMVENRTDHGRPVILVCTNRIEAMERGARVDAVRTEALARSAMGTARISLGVARSAIERDQNLSAEQRAQALAGIAQAEAELHDPANN